MFDQPLSNIRDFIANLRFENLSDKIVGAAVRHHLDSVGCAIGGRNKEPCQIARRVASTTAADLGNGVSVIGLPEKVSPEQAVFANTAMVRTLDYSDTYADAGSGHPSDMVMAVVAAAELARASGEKVALGVYTAYETMGAFADVYAVRAHGWDNGMQVALGSALGASVVLGSTPEQAANAAAIALTANMPLRTTRTGVLSHWKGCATSHSAMCGYFAARIAREGLTAPGHAFSGYDGLDRQIPPSGPLQMGKLRNGLSVLERTQFKYYPAENNSQALIHAFLRLRGQIDLKKVKRIVITTNHRTWHEISGGQNDAESRWDPRNRETADHSLPYLLAVALVDGGITLASFEEKRFLDPALRPVMKLIEVYQDDEMTRVWPGEVISRLEIDFLDGSNITETLSYPPGHPKNPMTDGQLEHKLRTLLEGALPEKATDSLVADLWRLLELDAIEQLTSYYRQVKVAK